MADQETAKKDHHRSDQRPKSRRARASRNVGSMLLELLDEKEPASGADRARRLSTREQILCFIIDGAVAGDSACLAQALELMQIYDTARPEVTPRRPNSKAHDEQFRILLELMESRSAID